MRRSGPNIPCSCANLGPITPVLGQVYDRFMFLVAWAYKTRCQAGEGSNQELRGLGMAGGWPCQGRALSRLPSATSTPLAGLGSKGLQDYLLCFFSPRALKALWSYLTQKGVNSEAIWEKIKDIVIKTIIA